MIKLTLQSLFNRSPLVCLAMALFLVACGGQYAGVEGTGKPSNNIGAIASADADVIVVNGIEQKISDDTQITVDGHPSDADGLSVGQLVQIDGEFNLDGATAESKVINYISNVIGYISDVQGATITVLGQDVEISSTTVFGEGLSDKALELGQKVRVSGLIAASGIIQATRIDIDVSDQYQVIGTIDITANTLSINGQLIDFGGARVIGELVDGAFVKVIGLQLDENDILIASVVEVMNKPLAKGSAVFLEGLVTAADPNNSTSFSVSGFDITADFDGVNDDDTVIVNGDHNDILLDARVRVLGTVQVNGSLAIDLIYIIHTSPITITGLVDHDKVDTYPIETNALDVGMWITLSDLDGWIGLELFRIENGRRTKVKSSWALNEDSNGVIFLPYAGQAQWEVDAIGNGVGDTLRTNYTLKIFKRRESLDEIKDIEAGQPFVVYQGQGGKNTYRVSTAQAPLGSFMAVRVEGIQNKGVLQIKRDGFELFDENLDKFYDCDIGNEVIVSEEEPLYPFTCWLDNEGVNDWYFSLESYNSQRYKIYIEFIVPTDLSLGGAVAGQIQGDFAQLYKFKATEQTASVSVLASGLENTDSSADDVEVRMRADAPPVSYHYDCISEARSFNDEQCVLPNEGVTDWYVVVYGNRGITYNIQMQASDVEPSLQELPFGEEHLFEQSAATIRHFKVPKGDPESVFVIGIEEDGAGFQMDVRDSLDGTLLCRLIYIAGADRRICRLYEDDRDRDIQEYWYIEVKSATSGHYHLWTAEQELTELQAGVPVRNVLNEAHPGIGMLYRIAIPESSTLFTATVTNKTKPMFMVAKNDGPPYFQKSNCGGRGLFLKDNGCVINSYVPPFAYILVGGEENGAEYTLTAQP